MMLVWLMGVGWVVGDPAMARAQVHSAQLKTWVMAKLPDTPEGLAIDSKGNVYATVFHTGEVVRLKQDGTYEHVAWVPSKEESGKGLLAGIDFDRAGNIYVAYKGASKYDAEDLTNRFHPACRDATVTRSGVYRIDARTRAVTALATRAEGWPFCFPDDVAVDSAGNVYLTDLTYSGIWKISADGKKVELWSSHRLLNWPEVPASGYPLGVNDLVLDREEKNIYAVTDGNPAVLRIRIREDGTADKPEVVGEGEYGMLDGVTLDANGNIYVSDVMWNEIWVISPDGSQRIRIASRKDAPLDDNTSLVVKGNVLCTANLGYSHLNRDEAARTVVCMTGFAVPR